MNECERSRLLSAYYDGELTPQTQQELEEHLPRCRFCARELEQIRRLSGLFGRAEIPEISEAVRERLHLRLAVPSERAVFKLAELLTMAAATVLILCGGLLWRTPTLQAGSAAPPVPWEQAAVTHHTDMVAAATEPQFAQWIVEDLSQE